MKALVSKIWYECPANKPILHIKCRKDDGTFVVIENQTVRPYFYSNQAMKHSLLIDTEWNVTKDLFGETVHKYYTNLPKEIPLVRTSFNKTWQADIPFSLLGRIDLGIKSYVDLDGDKLTPIPFDATIKPRIAYIDIETESYGGIPKADNPHQKILSNAVYDNFSDALIVAVVKNGQEIKPFEVEKYILEVLGDKYPMPKLFIKVVEDEVKLFEMFEKYLKTHEPDIITGWNVEDFDVAYIQARSEKLNSKVSFRRVAIMDMMERYERLHENELDSKALKFCANHELGISKLEYSEASPKELYDKNINKFCAYNAIDVILTKLMNEKRGILDFFISLSATAGCELESYHATKLLDMMLLHRLKGVCVLPSKGDYHEHIKYDGGYVQAPSKGVFDNVFVGDLKSEYPSIILSFNLSPETIVPSTQVGHDLLDIGARFKVKMDKRGIIPLMLEDIMGQRDAIRAEMDRLDADDPRQKVLNDQQRTLKELFNSFYGAMAFGGFRLYSPAIPEFVASTGRKLVQWVCEYVKKKNYTVLYADTDSCFFRDEANLLTIDVGKKLINDINLTFDDFARQYKLTKHYFNIKLEKHYVKWYQGGVKKRYAGMMVWKDGKILNPPKLDVKGMDIKRSSASKYTRGWLSNLIQVVLTGNKQFVLKMVEAEQEKWNKRKIDYHEMGIPCGISKEFSEYKSNAIHIRAVKWSNEHLGKNFGAGDKPHYFFVNHAQTNVIALDRNDKWPEGYELDWKNHYRRCFEMSTEAMLEGINIKLTKIDTRTRKLEL
jgi:DNA polymerase I